VTAINENVFGRDTKALGHFLKVDPEKEFGGEFIITVSNNYQPDNLPSVKGAYDKVKVTSSSAYTAVATDDNDGY